MPCHRKAFTLDTKSHSEIIDITARVRAIVAESGAKDGLVSIYTPHATAAVTINENADPNIGKDFLTALGKLVVEHDGWLHDRIDNNAAAHIKSALIGPSEVVPLADGDLSLGTWQNVFFCEFDGPRRGRTVIVSILS
jgi:secondary thiamine-phosphate synthase enzyme